MNPYSSAKSMKSEKNLFCLGEMKENGIASYGNSTLFYIMISRNFFSSVSDFFLFF